MEEAEEKHMFSQLAKEFIFKDVPIPQKHGYRFECWVYREYNLENLTAANAGNKTTNVLIAK